jgi:hypothetical protein
MFVWPFLAHSKELEIRELGVKFSEIPDAATAPSLTERPEGYEGEIRFEDAAVFVYRADDLVPAGSSLADASFRAAVVARNDNPRAPKSAGQLTILDGHEAWAYVEVSRPVAYLPVSSYTCILFAIVDQHLYRLTASAATTGKKPPAYDALVNALATVSFEPAQRPPREVPESSAVLGDKMPRFVFATGSDLYPPISIRLREQGAVDFEFSIDASGRIKDLTERYAAGKHLDQFIPDVLHKGIFRVPKDWEQMGSDRRRFIIEFQFSLTRRGSHCDPNQAPPHIPGAEVIRVCTTF